MPRSIFQNLIELPTEERIKLLKSFKPQEQAVILEELNAYEREQCKSLKVFTKYAWQNTEAEQYLDNWHIEAICDHLEAVTNGEIRNLIINIPPRSMKSLSTCVFWPAWTWTHTPQYKWIYASHSRDLAVDMSVKCRNLIESDWYKSHWGDVFQITEDQNKKHHYINSKKGERYCTSVGSKVTGFGGDTLVVDDPLDASDAESPIIRDEANRWWTETMSTRLNNPKKGTKVIIMQRLHENDLTGYLLAKDSRYEHLCLPMRYEPNHPYMSKTSLDFLDPRTKQGELLFPQRVSEEALDDLESDMGAYSVAGQLQQRPAPRDSGMFKRSWFEIVDEPYGKVRHRVRHWDLASTEKRASNDPDYTVGLLLSLDDKGNMYIEDIKRIRESAQKVERLIKDCAKKDGYTTIISLPQDPGQAGSVQADYYKRELAGTHAAKVYTERESGNKITRAEVAETQAEAGCIKLIKGHWNEAFLNEVEVFPNGRYDDQVDALSGAVAKLIPYKKRASRFNLADFKDVSTWKFAKAR